MQVIHTVILGDNAQATIENAFDAVQFNFKRMSPQEARMIANALNAAADRATDYAVRMHEQGLRIERANRAAQQAYTDTLAADGCPF